MLVKLTIRNLRRLILREFGAVGPSVSVAVDPTQKEDQPSLHLDDEAKKLQKGFYPYDIERGVPAPPPIIKSDKLGP